MPRTTHISLSKSERLEIDARIAEITGGQGVAISRTGYFVHLAKLDRESKLIPIGTVLKRSRWQGGAS